MFKKSTYVSYDDLYNEVMTLKGIRHPNIIKVHSMNSIDKTLMTKICGLDLNVYLNRFDPPQKIKLNMVGQIVDAVSFLNKNGILHGDIKLENIVYDGITRLIDFELSINNFTQGNNTVIIYTRGYRAPEICWGDVSYGINVESWAVGVVIYQMFGEINFCRNKSISGVFKDIIDVVGGYDKYIDKFSKIIYFDKKIKKIKKPKRLIAYAKKSPNRYKHCNLDVGNPYVNDLLGKYLVFDPMERQPMNESYNGILVVYRLPKWKPNIYQSAVMKYYKITQNISDEIFMMTSLIMFKCIDRGMKFSGKLFNSCLLIYNKYRLHHKNIGPIPMELEILNAIKYILSFPKITYTQFTSKYL
jgi:serine/threonine protein kinase